MKTLISSSPKSWRIISIAYFIILSGIILMAYLGIFSTKPGIFPHFDKVVHFISIGFSAFLFHKQLDRKKILNNKIALGPLLIILLFAIEEYVQRFSSMRSSTIFDFIANTSGVISFMLIEKRWPDIGPTWAIEKMQRVCAFLYWQLRKLKEKQTL